MSAPDALFFKQLFSIMLLTEKQALAHLRIVTGDEPNLSLYISAAEQVASDYTGRAFYVSENELNEAVKQGIAGPYPIVVNDAILAGSSAGTFRKINGWTSLSQILSSSSTGGEQQFLEYQFLESDTQKRIPTFKNAAGLTFAIANDATQAGYLLAAEASEDRQPRAVRITLPNGGILLYNAYISINKTPKLSVHEIMSVDVTLSLLTEPVRY